MIDPKELRVGATVSIGGKMQRVAAIDVLNGQIGIDAYTTDAKGVKHPFGYKVEDVEPIALTPELLRDLGFQYRDNTYWEHWFLGGFDIERKDGSSYFDYNSAIRLEYLHELEYLYYLIYGQELIKE